MHYHVRYSDESDFMVFGNQMFSVLKDLFCLFLNLDNVAFRVSVFLVAQELKLSPPLFQLGPESISFFVEA